LAFAAALKYAVQLGLPPLPCGQDWHDLCCCAVGACRGWRTDAQVEQSAALDKHDQVATYLHDPIRSIPLDDAQNWEYHTVYRLSVATALHVWRCEVSKFIVGTAEYSAVPIGGWKSVILGAAQIAVGALRRPRGAHCRPNAHWRLRPCRGQGSHAGNRGTGVRPIEKAEPRIHRPSEADALSRLDTKPSGRELASVRYPYRLP
jgi:hypothetical protein